MELCKIFKTKDKRNLKKTLLKVLLY